MIQLSNRLSIGIALPALINALIRLDPPALTRLKPHSRGLDVLRIDGEIDGDVQPPRGRSKRCVTVAEWGCEQSEIFCNVLDYSANSPLRAAVTAMAQVQTPVIAVQAKPDADAPGDCARYTAPTGLAGATAPEPAPAPEPPAAHKRAAHYLWAVLMARIYEVFPFLCPICGGHMRIIAFITHIADIRHILDHIGVESEPPHITSARGPPLWDNRDAQPGAGSQIEPDWDMAAQSDPDFEVDQRISW